MTTTEVRTTQDLDFTQDSYAKECLQVEERPRRVLRDTIPSGPHELASLLAKDEVDRCNSDSSRKNFMRKTYKSKYSPPASPTASLHSTLTNRVSSDNEQVSPRTLSAPSPISLDPVLKSTSVVLPRSIGKVTKQAPSIDSPFKHPIHTTNTTRRTCAEIQSLHNSDQADKLTTPNLEAVTIRPPNLPLVKSATPTISSIDRKHYVSIDMPIPTEQMRIWEGGLASRLEDALRRSSRATHDSEAPLALEFYMVGTSTKDLRACIVITCCSSSRKKALKSFLGGLKWLRDSGLQHIILVDKTFGHRASKSLTNVAADSTFKINARLPSKISTLCGIEAETSKACPNGQSDEIARFTLGGVIFLDGRAYCLTVAHPFGASMHGSQSSSSSTIDRTESDSDDSEFDSPLDGTSHASSNDVKDSFNRRFYPDMVPNTGHIGAQQLKTPGKDEHRDPKHPLRPFPYKSMVNHNDVSFLRQATISKEPDKLDWALLLLEADYAVPNVFRIPGEDEDIEIGGYLSVENLTSGSVWVVAGSGVQQGTLNGNLASIYLWGHFHKVKQITLQRSLRKFLALPRKYSCFELRIFSKG